MKRTFTYFAFIALFFSSCKPSDSSNEMATESDSLAVVQDSLQNDLGSTQSDDDNLVRLVQLTLQDKYKQDLEKGWVDTLSRKFIYAQMDLNEDGNKELFVGLTGPYFCGSGGCTLFLLTYQGDVITEFSVVRPPVYIDTENTSGWKNLILYSGGENRVAKWNGTSYPSNPSTLPLANGRPLDTKLLDWESQQSFTF